MRQAGALRYLLDDHLGSTTHVLNSSGGLVGTAQKCYPYGRTHSGAVGRDKQFTGHQLEGSVYFMKARFYDPYLGRFTGF
jgi:hypothetical protein